MSEKLKIDENHGEEDNNSSESKEAWDLSDAEQGWNEVRIFMGEVEAWQERSANELKNILVN